MRWFLCLCMCVSAATPLDKNTFCMFVSAAIHCTFNNSYNLKLRKTHGECWDTRNALSLHNQTKHGLWNLWNCCTKCPKKMPVWQSISNPLKICIPLLIFFILTQISKNSHSSITVRDCFQFELVGKTKKAGGFSKFSFRINFIYSC
jgi:hypothetical protein